MNINPISSNKNVISLINKFQINRQDKIYYDKINNNNSNLISEKKRVDPVIPPIPLEIVLSDLEIAKKNERIKKERLEKERLEKEKFNKEVQEKIEWLKEKKRLEKEKIKKKILEKERLEKERFNKEVQEKIEWLLEKEKLKKEKLEKGRLEKERLEKEKIEKERLEKERFNKEVQEKLNWLKEQKEKIKEEKLQIEIKKKEDKNRIISLLNLSDQNNIPFALFHKYFLELSHPFNKISFNISQNNTSKEFKEKKYYAHLHCYDISKFNEIYGEYIDTITKYFRIIITYSIGKNTIDKNRNYVILNIPNKGLDIGAKFCAVAYLNNNKISYDYILFLHSKSNPETRKKYFEPLINNLDDEFIQNISDYDGYFPDIEWEIVGDKLKWISNNPHFKNHENTNWPERNLLYRNELLKYCKPTNNTNRFIEGNCYILSKNVIEKLYTDTNLYNILNTETSFDYDWICKAYNIQGDIYEVYKQFIERKLAPKNKRSFDGCFEHVFERVVLNFCDNYLIMNFNLDKILNNDIAIIACYPNFLNTYFWVQNLIKECKFKKIYIIYSDVEENGLNNNLFDKINLSYVEIIKIDNIGYDFGKYFYGMKLIKNKNEKFNKVWLINDSFVIDNISDMIKKYYNIYYSKIAGCYLSNEIKMHMQSYMLILDNDSFNYYFNQLNCYNFIDIKTINDKKNLILDLEINLNNQYIINNNYCFNTLYKIEKYNENPALMEGYLNGFLKGEIIRMISNKSYEYKNFLSKRYHNESDLYMNLYSFIFTESIKKLYFEIYNKSKLINYHIPLFNNSIFENLQIIKNLKIYNGDNNHINLLQQIFFNFKSNNYTNKENLKEKIYDIQKQSQNKKLVYTSNINQYDTFLDIDDKFIENDVDYIYVSNCLDADVCKNFKYIYSNIEGLDNFEINRMIKFDKTLFDCYKKVLYIDSNVTIHKKLDDFWNNLDNDSDLVLFSHPDRNFVLQEINELKNSIQNHNKWNLENNKLNELCENFKGNLNNDLFWLNVQLSTTKMNIYQEIEEMYEKYKLKRDQVYFSLIKNKYKIKTIKIAPCISDLLKFFQKSQIKHTCVDGDYNYLVNWSDKFSRPFGGAHL